MWSGPAVAASAGGVLDLAPGRSSERTLCSEDKGVVPLPPALGPSVLGSGKGIDAETVRKRCVQPSTGPSGMLVAGEREMGPKRLTWISRPPGWHSEDQLPGVRLSSADTAPTCRGRKVQGHRGFSSASHVPRLRWGLWPLPPEEP
ncbi:unnamed protein product [Rangifer tarandus platyrhynchus]|uniref:Uncharacterized protein n=1 Tax=Rangifer tarandus platyrhynchus TaxID=3082113 RepID=A0ABN8Y8K3_RANTA|nr:unnamed protein product [Rangifer tarandus platyrhynchus]